MKLSEAVICVNMVNCQACGGRGHIKIRRSQRTKYSGATITCLRCSGDKDYQEECAELLHSSALRCNSCTGTSLLLLSKLINKVKEKENV